MIKTAAFDTALQKKHKLPIHITTYLSWREILQLLKNHQDKVVVHIPSKSMRSTFTPEEETILLKSTRLYTDEFIKRNEQVKKNIKKKGVVCSSVNGLRESLTK